MTTVFYSWQSDHPGKTHRNFIEKALKEAISSVSADLEVVDALRDQELVLDKDTQDIPGSPPIVDVIFNKIANAGIFVGDLSYVAQNDGRSVSNPNVLIEYGWALSKLTHSRIITVANGPRDKIISQLPFDMKHLRGPVCYQLESECEPAKKKAVYNQLVKDLVERIKGVISSGVIPSSIAKDDEPRTVPARSFRDGSTFVDPSEPFCEERYHGNANPTGCFVANGPRIYLRVIPRTKIAPFSFVELKKRASGNLSPFGYFNGYSYSTNSFGVVIYERAADLAASFALTQVFRSGEIWGICTFRTEGNDRDIPAIERKFVDKLAEYFKFQSEFLGIKSDVDIIVGVTGILGSAMYLPSPPAGYRRDIPRKGRAVLDKVEWTANGVSLESDPLELLNPFFDEVYDCFTLDRRATNGLPDGTVFI